MTDHSSLTQPSRPPSQVLPDEPVATCMPTEECTAETVLDGTYTSSFKVSAPKRWLQYLVIFLTVILMALAVAFAYLMFGEGEKSAEEVPSLEQGENSSEHAVSQFLSHPTLENEIVYLHNGDIWSLTKEGEGRQLSTTDGSVLRYASDKEKLRIVYLQQELMISQNGKMQTDPVRVVFLNLEDGEQRVIFELQPQIQPNSEYVFRIQDVGISEDGTKIAYSTSDAIYVYDVATGKSERVYYAPVIMDNINDLIFSYYTLQFSPDNQKLLVHKGYWEWSKPAIFDLTTKQMTDLPFRSGNGRGDDVFAWFGSTHFLGFEYSMADKESFSFFITDLTGVQKSNEVKIDGSFYRNNLFLDPSELAVYGILSEQKLNGKVLNGIPLSDQISSIVKLSVKTGQTSTLYTQNITDDSIDQLYMSDDYRYAFFQYTTSSAQGSVEKKTMYRLDISQPNSIPQEVAVKYTQ